MLVLLELPNLTRSCYASWMTQMQALGARLREYSSEHGQRTLVGV